MNMLVLVTNYFLFTSDIRISTDYSYLVLRSDNGIMLLRSSEKRLTINSYSELNPFLHEFIFLFYLLCQKFDLSRFPLIAQTKKSDGCPTNTPIMLPPRPD